MKGNDLFHYVSLYGCIIFYILYLAIFYIKNYNNYKKPLKLIKEFDKNDRKYQLIRDVEIHDKIPNLVFNTYEKEYKKCKIVDLIISNDEIYISGFISDFGYTKFLKLIKITEIRSDYLKILNHFDLNINSN